MCVCFQRRLPVGPHEWGLFGSLACAGVGASGQPALRERGALRLRGCEEQNKRTDVAPVSRSSREGWLVLDPVTLGNSLQRSEPPFLYL